MPAATKESSHSTISESLEEIHKRPSAIHPSQNLVFDCRRHSITKTAKRVSLKHTHHNPIYSQHTCYRHKYLMILYQRYVETASDSCMRTNKWTGRQLLRSPVAGSNVNQDKALYLSRTCLKTSQVVVESNGWLGLLCPLGSLADVGVWMRSAGALSPSLGSLVCADGTWICNAALKNDGHAFSYLGALDQNQ